MLAGLQSAGMAGHSEEAVARARSRLAALGAGLSPGDTRGDDGGLYRWRLRVAPIAAARVGPNVAGGILAKRVLALLGQLNDLLAGGEPHAHCAARHETARYGPGDGARGRAMRHQGGFTLLEVLVALVVLGMLVLGLTQGIHFGLKTWASQTRTIAAHEDLDAVDRTLRRLIESMDPGSPAEAVSIDGSASSFAFPSELPDFAAALPSRRADVALGVDAAHRLVLRWTPHLHAVRLGPAPPAQQSELLRGVDHVELAYWPSGAGGGWQTLWKQPLPPALVRIRLVFTEGDKRHWPDIIAAPIRDRSEE